ncbi:gamma-butyrobetaine dioxygenase-like isoform X1 [Penaeus japonicus]|uniref:gamma-butyrobetaine dioxygenase-like isoform X1 n=2 Tax=Penaeus japonicus TaxID=27405 RepID=UPI001C714A0D|nr:gamma-butyrobetaine dioxygenase-like isoform X1 [Penaeus japonicus]
MSSLRCSRALIAGAAVLRGVARQQVRTSCHRNLGRRCLSLAATARQQAEAKMSDKGAKAVASATKDFETLHVQFTDGSSCEMPYVWLRDNCQCDHCFSDGALGRKLLMQDFDVEVHAIGVKETGGGITVDWNDGHKSNFDGEWLHERAFSPTARARRRNQFAYSKEPWGADHVMAEFDYKTLMSDDKALLDWLVTMEKKGSAMVKNAPDRDIAGPELIEHIAYVKPSHYGPHSPVINRPNSNNVAFTNAKLGMHNDLAQYEHMPGIIFIHCVKQHIGTGGESVVSDGLYAAEILRKTNPEAFNILTSTDAYFWDKGQANYSWEMPEFYKISRHPILTLNSNKEVCRVSVNNAVRDSYLDLPAHRVKEFYSAMKLFNDILYDNSLSFKMDTGDMMTLDNVRCLHGREGYEAFSERHIESSYLDWDEARCRRRRLQEELGVADLK